MADETQNDGSTQNNEGIKDARLANLRPWQPGQSGNPGGRPKKKPVTDLYEEMLQDPEFVDSVRAAIVSAVRKGSMAMVLQLKEMTERVEGKVVTPIEADVTVTATLADRMRKARERVGD
jgi:hypothetical protein